MLDLSTFRQRFSSPQFSTDRRRSSRRSRRNRSSLSWSPHPNQFFSVHQFIDSSIICSLVLLTLGKRESLCVFSHIRHPEGLWTSPGSLSIHSKNVIHLSQQSSTRVLLPVKLSDDIPAPSFYVCLTIAPNVISCEIQRRLANVA